MPPLRPPRSRSTFHFTVNFSKNLFHFPQIGNLVRSSPHQILVRGSHKRRTDFFKICRELTARQARRDDDVCDDAAGVAFSTHGHGLGRLCFHPGISHACNMMSCTQPGHSIKMYTVVWVWQHLSLFVVPAAPVSRMAPQLLCMCRCMSVWMLSAKYLDATPRQSGSFPRSTPTFTTTDLIRLDLAMCLQCDLPPVHNCLFLPCFSLVPFPAAALACDSGLFLRSSRYP